MCSGLGSAQGFKFYYITVVSLTVVVQTVEGNLTNSWKSGTHGSALQSLIYFIPLSSAVLDLHQEACVFNCRSVSCCWLFVKGLRSPDCHIHRIVKFDLFHEEVLSSSGQESLGDITSEVQP